MLDAYIIEELKRREREGDERDSERRPELPIPGHEETPLRQSDEDKPQRVVIIDYSV